MHGRRVQREGRPDAGDRGLPTGNSGRTVNGTCYDISVPRRRPAPPSRRWPPAGTRRSNGPAPDVWTPAASTWVSLLSSDLTANDRPNIVPATSTVGDVHPAGAGDARADGHGAGLAGHPDRLVRRADPGPGPAGVGGQGPSGMGPVHPRQDQSERLHLGAGRHHRRPGGRHRNLVRPDRGRAATPGRAAVPQGRGDLGDPLRRHHTDLSGRTCNAPTTRAPRSATCPPSRSRRRASWTTTPATPAATRPRSAGTPPPKVPLVAVYPKEGTLYSDSPYVDPRRALVDGGEAGRRPGFPGLPAAARTAEGVHRQLLPHRGRCTGGPDHRQSLRARGRCPDRVEPAGRRCAARRSCAVGGGPQERPGAAGDGRFGVDGRGLRVRRQVEARVGQVRRRDRARINWWTPTRSGSGPSPPISRHPPRSPGSGSTSDRSVRPGNRSPTRSPG